MLVNVNLVLLLNIFFKERLKRAGNNNEQNNEPATND